MKRTLLLLFAIVAAIALLSASYVFAQQVSATTSKTRTATQQPTAQAQAATANAKGRLTAPPTGPRDYDCAGGNCSCAGAKDCVDMKKICAPGTLGCNDYGCTCAEAEGGDG